MPIPEDIVRWRINFALGQAGVTEQAVMGGHLGRAHLGGNTVDWPANVQELATKIRDKWISNINSRATWDQNIIAKSVETYHLDAATGHTLDKGTAGFVPGSTWTGSSSSGSLPTETSCVVSLYGYQPGQFAVDAKYKRGRIFLPPFGIATMDDTGTSVGLYKVTTQQAVSGMVTAFFNDLEGMTVGGGAIPDTVSPVILSKTRGIATKVVAVRVGRVPDSQRRRRRSLVESYLDTAVT